MLAVDGQPTPRALSPEQMPTGRCTVEVKVYRSPALFSVFVPQPSCCARCRHCILDPLGVCFCQSVEGLFVFSVDVHATSVLRCCTQPAASVASPALPTTSPAVACPTRMTCGFHSFQWFGSGSRRWRGGSSMKSLSVTRSSFPKLPSSFPKLPNSLTEPPNPFPEPQQRTRLRAVSPALRAHTQTQIFHCFAGVAVEAPNLPTWTECWGRGRSNPAARKIQDPCRRIGARGGGFRHSASG